MPTPTRVLSPDELLTTTRSVRKRLDLTRPVERELLEQCVRIALQAPTASNDQNWHFLIVTDPRKKLGLADLYRRSAERYLSNPEAPINRHLRDQQRNATAERVKSSAEYLAEHLHEVPVHVIPRIAVRPETLPLGAQASVYGSILPAAWSFMLAARARGLGTCWTTLHLVFEHEAADLLGIPRERIAQVGLIPVAHTIGDEFKPGGRLPLESVLHWESW
jgi:nitroreductase